MTNITNEQLEAWAGLGPWRVGKSLGGGFPAITKDFRLGHNTHITGAVHGYMYHADQKANQADNAALIAAAPDLARLVLEKDKEIARLKAALSDLIPELEEWNTRGCGRNCYIEGAPFDVDAIRQAMKETSDENRNPDSCASRNL